MKPIKILILVWSCCALFACANSNQSVEKTTQSNVAHEEVKSKVVEAEAEKRQKSTTEETIKTEVAETDTQGNDKAPDRNPEYQNGGEKVKVETKKEQVKSVIETKPPASSEKVKVAQDTDKSKVENVVKEVNKPTEVVTEVKTKVEEVKTQPIETVKEQKPVINTPVAEEPTVRVDKPQKPGRLAQSRPMHKYFDYLLKTHVSSTGVVDYKGIKSDVERLDKYISDLENFPPNDDWERSEQLAYWINAYNAYTIKLIVENYPLSSITDLHGGKPWDHKWINIDGKSLSLNNIENDIIRPTFKEPRIHFAVNCAAKSCPPLMNAAYTKDNLETMLATSTGAFINNSQYNDLTKKPAEISKIFDWYGEDFGDVVTYINKYMKLRQPPIEKVVYSAYDWSLNDK